jgi:transcriptional regulator
MKVNIELYEKVLHLRTVGKSNIEIARTLELSTTKVANIFTFLKHANYKVPPAPNRRDTEFDMNEFLRDVKLNIKEVDKSGKRSN